MGQSNRECFLQPISQPSKTPIHRQHPPGNHQEVVKPDDESNSTAKKCPCTDSWSLRSFAHIAIVVIFPQHSCTLAAEPLIWSVSYVPGRALLGTVVRY